MLFNRITQLILSSKKILKKVSKFKVFTIEYVKDMVKDKISVGVSNQKLSISSSKITLITIKQFSILTINNKHIKSMPILQSIFRASANKISIPNHFSY